MLSHKHLPSHPSISFSLEPQVSPSYWYVCLQSCKILINIIIVMKIKIILYEHIIIIKKLTINNFKKAFTILVYKKKLCWNIFSYNKKASLELWIPNIHSLNYQDSARGWFKSSFFLSNSYGSSWVNLSKLHNGLIANFNRSYHRFHLTDWFESVFTIPLTCGLPSLDFRQGI